MSLTAQSLTNTSDPQHLQGELCEICLGKDEEDLYIVFNTLFRIFVGEVFHEDSEKIADDHHMNPTTSNSMQQSPHNSNEERFKQFRQEVSQQALIDIISSSRFDLLLREIFKSKHSRVQETNCKHHELIKRFIRGFNLTDDKSNMNKKRAIENSDRLEALYNKVKQLKTEIESYHAEIDELPNRIVKKLLVTNPNLDNRRVIAVHEEEENDDDQSSEDFDSSEPKKPETQRSQNGRQASSSTAPSLESGSNSGSSDKVAEADQGDKQKQKKSKAATFKSKLPKKSTDVLKTWFLTNIQNPYPSHEVKEMLSKMTSLTRKQIQNWFTNSRKRFLEPLKRKIEAQKQNNKDGVLLSEAVQAIFSPESQSQIEQMENSNSCEFQEQTTLKLPQQTPQAKPVQTPSVIPVNIVNNGINEEATQKPAPVQKITPQIQQLQPIIYPTAIQSANNNLGGNFVLVPWVIPQSQPVYSYRPNSNVFPIANSPMISFPQGNYLSGNFPVINSAYMFSPAPPNSIDMNSMMKQPAQVFQYPQQGQIPSTMGPIVPINNLCGVNQLGNMTQPMFLPQDKRDTGI